MPLAKMPQFEHNAERNRRLYESWELGYTIRDAAAATSDPEGTVAYYWRKFNRAARTGRPIPIDSKTDSEIQLEEFMHASENLQLKNKIEELVNKGQFQQAKDLLEIAERSNALGLRYASSKLAFLAEEFKKEEKRSKQITKELDSISEKSIRCDDCGAHTDKLTVEHEKPKTPKTDKMLQFLKSNKWLSLPYDSTRMEVQHNPRDFIAFLEEFNCNNCNRELQEVSIHRLKDQS